MELVNLLVRQLECLLVLVGVCVGASLGIPDGASVGILLVYLFEFQLVLVFVNLWEHGSSSW